MDFDSRIPIPREHNSLSPLLNRDAMWQINVGSDDTIDGFGAYPERPGEPDCSYYIRTGLCRFGSTCRFNHPHDRKLVITTARVNGEEYPERIGQPECEYYIKTGTCKFGVTCKFDHPRNKAGIAGKVSLNVLGYPLRPNEDDCSYFLRTGHCKFGVTCKFNHPQSASMMFSLRGSSVYPPVQSPTGQQWSRPSFPSSFPSLLLPQGVVSVQGWNTYSGQFGALSPSGSDHNYRNQQQDDGKESSSPSLLSTGYHSSSMPLGFYALPRENVFPERPGQPECQFYMKTGDCKFGTVCKFHHPKDRQIPPPDCALSPVSLPLRPGEPLCVFYSRYGICKFGPSCKFDHPMRVFTYTNPSSLQPVDTTTMPLSLLLVPSSSSPPMVATESQTEEEVVEQSSGTEKTRRVSVSETASGQDNNSNDATEE